MKTALFVNFTNQEFIGYWDGKGRTYPPGASEYMPDYLAQHYAKHLTNRELLRTTLDGTLIHKGGDKMTSPKKPEDTPLFMELFNKAYIPDDIDDIGNKRDDLDSLIGSANKNRADKIAKVEAKIKDAPPISSPRQAKPQEDENFAKPKGQDPIGPQVVLPADWNEIDEEEGSFQGKPVENVPAA
ncbi:hypothetical protein A2125_01495 [Candidatus Woesebacteria bacterium GWB1_43_5]|uniref:Uncharacterized protein n=1 Tax=Candidatus Woesebacteria bacterium GWB1_43_5 TaxID=1802474 RepID=A0A1F7WTE2_9BACT|nr:MAG: hypothetical protein A2125_01495 [Candidatus Woesebacteria bacterium GWB1_43_5]